MKLQGINIVFSNEGNSDSLNKKFFSSAGKRQYHANSPSVTKKLNIQLADTCLFLTNIIFLITCNRNPYLQWFQYNFYPSWRYTRSWHFRRNSINILNSWYYSVQELEIPYNMSFAIAYFAQQNLISFS